MSALSVTAEAMHAPDRQAEGEHRGHLARALVLADRGRVVGDQHRQHQGDHGDDAQDLGQLGDHVAHARDQGVDRLGRDDSGQAEERPPQGVGIGARPPGRPWPDWPGRPCRRARRRRRPCRRWAACGLGCVPGQHDLRLDQADGRLRDAHGVAQHESIARPEVQILGRALRRASPRPVPTGSRPCGQRSACQALSRRSRTSSCRSIGSWLRRGAARRRRDSQHQVHPARARHRRQLGADRLGRERRGQVDGDPVRAAADDLGLAAVDARGERVEHARACRSGRSPPPRCRAPSGGSGAASAGRC